MVIGIGVKIGDSFKNLQDIDINLDDNNDGFIDNNEIANSKDELDNLSKVNQEIDRLDNEIGSTTDLKLNKLLRIKRVHLGELYENISNVSDKIRIEETRVKIIDLRNDIGNNIANYRNGEELIHFTSNETELEIIKMGSDLNSYEIDDYNYYFKNIFLLKLIKAENYNKILEITSKEGLGYIIPYLVDMINGGFNKEQIVNIIKTGVGKDRSGDILFENIDILERIGITGTSLIDIIIQISNDTNSKGFIDEKVIEILKNNTSDHKKIMELLLKSAKNNIINLIDDVNYDFFLNILIGEYKEGLNRTGLTYSEISQLFRLLISKKGGYKVIESLDKFRFFNDPGFSVKNILHILGGTLGEEYEGFKSSFIENYNKQIVIEDRSDLLLGKGFEKYKRDFKDEESYKKFIELILIKDSSDISRSVNSIYDYYEESEIGYKYGTYEDEVGSETIIGQIKENLGKYSTEELLSSLGNHSTNYSTTFNLIIKELDLRGTKQGFNNYFDFINKSKNLTDFSKVFLKGQVIAGLSARGKVNKVNILLKDHGGFSIIEKIINYKQNSLFNISTYLGLVVGIKGIIKANTSLQKKIYNNYFKNNKNEKFKKALEISLGIDRQKLTTNGIEYLNDDEIKKIDRIRSKFILPNKEIFNQPTKDMVYIYGGGKEGGGTENYKKEIDYYKKVDYEEIKSDKGFSILERDGVRVTFVNYDEILSVEKTFKENELNPIMISFRGHNYYTTKMIVELKNMLSEKSNSIIVDGGCRNISAVAGYRKKGIKNQIVAYTDTGKGAETFNFTSRFISYYLRDSKKYEDKELTLKELGEKILKEGSYAKDFMKFPGDLIDIVLKVEGGEI